MEATQEMAQAPEQASESLPLLQHQHVITGTELVINNEMADGTDGVQQMAVDDAPPNDLAVGTPGQPMVDDPQETPVYGSGFYEWRITEFSQKQTHLKLYSDEFEIGNYSWRILIFPRGNKTETQLSVYLDCPEADILPHHSIPRAQFKLTLINQLDATKSHHKETDHQFTARETDWGFTNFFALQDIEAQDSGFLYKDTLMLRVDVTVLREEMVSYNSRKETGHVGLKNQGATCYINSLLQSLFNIPMFRKAVYHMPTKEYEEPSSSVALALQSLFYKLENYTTSVPTKDLTRSFGWREDNDDYVNMQQDIQELNRILCENLEEKMKGTVVESTIKDLFEGSMISTIRCIDVDYKSERKETYMDLQLDVKGCKDLYESFDRYVEEETLEGQNQYQTEKYGLQDAKKGVKFERFPPVLNLHLKRFDYDYRRDLLVKINDLYKYYDELDLDKDGGKYLTANADRNVRNLYRLHSVMVHSGGLAGGHYYAFIRTDLSGQWLKFDDERVTRETAQKAIEEQYGKPVEDDPAAPTSIREPPGVKIPRMSNAYMLVYIRQSEWEHLMKPIDQVEVPEHLRLRLKREQEEKERRLKEKAEAHMYVVFRIATEADFRKQVGSTRHFDLVDHSQVQQVKVKKTDTVLQFRQRVADELGVGPVEQQVFFPWAKRMNHTYRPTKPMPPPPDNSQPIKYWQRDLIRQQANHSHRGHLYNIDFFLDAWPQLQWNPTMVVFCKHYDPWMGKLSYVGRLYVPSSIRVAEVLPQLREMGSLAEDADLIVYEEVKYDPSLMVEEVQLEQNFHLQEIDTGDILIFQEVVTQKPGMQHTPRFPTAKQYLQHKLALREVTFKQLSNPKEEGITLELTRDMAYQQIIKALGHALQMPDATCLRLTPHNSFSNQPQRTPVKFNAVDRLDALLQHGNTTSTVLYYEKLDQPLPDIERLKTLKLFFHNLATEFVSEVSIRMARDSSVAEALEEVRKQLPSEFHTSQLRMLKLANSKIFQTVLGDSDIGALDDNYWTLRVEPIPQEEQNMEADEQMVAVQHYARQTISGTPHVQAFGHPFFIKIGAKDTAMSVRGRIKDKLKVPDEEFTEWKLAIIHRDTPELLEDSTLLAPKFTEPDVNRWRADDSVLLGLEHEDKAPFRNRLYNNRLANYEKPVKIFR